LKFLNIKLGWVLKDKIQQLIAAGSGLQPEPKHFGSIEDD
jgi:hypothetical protein